jgi:hypothetical protein
MKNTTKIFAVLGVLLTVGVLAAFQIATDNTGGGLWTHIDLQAAGTCTAGASGTVRICGNSNALQFSVNGGTPYTMPANSVGLVDYAQMAPDTLQYVTLTLTNTQTLGMEAAPVAVVAAQGAGTLIEVVEAVVENLNTGTAYANGGVLTFGYGSSTLVAATEGSTTLAATFLTSPTVTTYGIVTGIGAALVGSTTANTGLYFGNLTAPFITGTGTVKLELTYRVRTL